ncbi:AMP-binding protein [Pseudonocardia nigra]|uniref:AMP-binding protein n=1 Tax=Pseudonocardia nigra TaxID=1921578 RepID=UPI001C5F6C7B|nr:AMP-binding protein [Pseudonocardia nigra]
MQQLNERHDREQPEVESSSPGTLVDLFVSRCRSHPERVAYCRHHLGLWEEVSWHQYGREVGAAVAALRRRRLAPGDHVAVMGDARPELVAVVLAGQLLGLRCVALYPSASSDEVRSIVEQVAPRLFVAEDDEDVHKLIQSGLAANVGEIAILDARGIQHVEIVPLRWHDLIAEVPACDLDELGALAAGIGPDEVASIAYSSGTGGTAKGAVLTHRNVVAAWSGALSLLPRIGFRDRVVVDAPLAHAAGHVTALVLPLLTGCVSFFVEDVEEVPAAIANVRPTVSVGTPRRWLKASRQITAAVAQSSFVKRMVFNTALPPLREDDGTGGKERSRSPMALLGYLAARRPVLRMLGYDELRVCVVGWGATSARTRRFWKRLGVDIRDLYGMAETAGAAAVATGPTVSSSTIGIPVPGTEIMLAPDGEILVRGPHVCLGLLSDRGAVTNALDDDGWFHTGDIGVRASDGSVSILDRVENGVVLADGRTLHPGAIERLLKDSAYVAEAVVFVDSAASVRALVELDRDTVREWARAHGVSYTSADDLPRQPAIREMIDSEVRQRNDELREQGWPVVERVEIVPGSLGHDELTPTRKIRTRFRHQLGHRG